MASLVSSAVKYWESGSVLVRPNPIPCDPATARPYVVRIDTPGCVPCNVLVFSDSCDDAEIRLLAALYECINKDYNGPFGGKYGRNRAHDLIEKLERGELVIRSEPLDVQVIANIQWASNGGVC